ncbi:hypothetical protein [Arthrobacter sp. zg-Y1143]|uniref:hypothetical protein n=1 Tax=Arthrobacter sp. zg-Y1143 TaxID=3049065 RepID=UPI0024C46538|nr:hypothetical protein [Arthrobacter sp. zg-Y1143]MDK1328114.1 hypothetical protein [Arthrobacter sp. zg-Y1143]
MSDRQPQRHSSEKAPAGSAPAAKRGAEKAPAADRDAEKQWQVMERDGGLFTISQIAQRLGFGGGQNAMARQLTGKGRILAVQRGGHFLYPGFQFEPAGGRVIPAVKDVIRMGRYAGWPDEQIALWFYTPNRQLSGKRPVDVRENEEQLLRVAEENISK